MCGLRRTFRRIQAMAPQSLTVADLGGAQCRGHDFEVRVFLTAVLDHLLERGDPVPQVLVRAFDFEAEACGKVFLVADHHVHVPGDLPVHLLRGRAADAFPERRPDNSGRRIRSCRAFGPPAWLRELRPVVSERAAKMPPVCSQRTPSSEDVIPVEVAGLQLAGGAVSAVRTADRPRTPKPRSVKLSPYTVAAHAVERHPLDMN